jgi:Asp-tRNA(Asn)/Glu-tRNA(Gln) amidotransferase A subunit family amidase
VIPLSPSLDHVGFFARNAAEARGAARVLYEDWEEPRQAAARPVLGVPEGPYLECASKEGLAHFQSVCEALARAGYDVRRVAAMPDFTEIRARHDLVLAAEAARVHAGWFEAYGGLYAPKTAELIRRGRSIPDAQLQTALNGCRALRHELGQSMQEHGIDLWIAPAAPGPAPKGLESTGDPVMNLPWTQAGLPAINLPAGRIQDGLPMGLQLVGEWHQDENLLGWAEDLEQVVSL